MPDPKSRCLFRYQLVSYALEHGIAACARDYRTTRRTVQLWVRRYDSESGTESLKSRSRVGQNHPQKLPEQDRERIISFRKKTKNQLGARTIVDFLDLKCSAKTVHKIIKQNGLVPKQAKRWQRRKDMSAIRALYKPFEKIQMDIKYLNDIPECYPAYLKGDIPKFMISARDYKTGWLFLAFTNYLDPISTGIYSQYLIQNFEKAKIDISGLSIQTDNGKEFVDRLKHRTTYFQKVLAGKVHHHVIPPASPRFNSDIESFHRLVENEFLKLEDIESFPCFVSKAYLYSIYFNFYRKNRNRGNKTPFQLLEEDERKLDPYMLSFPPIFCDRYRKDSLAMDSPVYFNWLPLSNKRYSEIHSA